jgi:hypothetical protein
VLVVLTWLFCHEKLTPSSRSSTDRLDHAPPAEACVAFSAVDATAAAAIRAHILASAGRCLITRRHRLAGLLLGNRVGRLGLMRHV